MKRLFAMAITIMLVLFSVQAVAQEEPPTEPYAFTLDPAQDVEIKYGALGWQPIAVQNVELLVGPMGTHAYVSRSGVDDTWEAKTPESTERRIRFVILSTSLPSGFFWYRIRCRVRLQLVGGMSDPGPWSEEPAYWVFKINRPGKPQRPRP